MNRPRKLWALFLAATLSAGSGCAVYEKCGFGGCPGDAEITGEVRARFEQHPSIGPPNLLGIQTLDKVVYLTGIFDTDYQRKLATSVAAETPGVVKVVNSIGLTGGSR